VNLTKAAEETMIEVTGTAAIAMTEEGITAETRIMAD
jgi:hypothetical protein